MSAYSDFVAFVDSGSKVPYFSKNGKYTNKPNIISLEFEYDFKIYYKSYNHYFVGISCNRFVRYIYKDEFDMMFKLYNDRQKTSVVNSQKVQLLFDL